MQEFCSSVDKCGMCVRYIQWEKFGDIYRMSDRKRNKKTTEKEWNNTKGLSFVNLEMEIVIKSTKMSSTEPAEERQEISYFICTTEIKNHDGRIGRKIKVENGSKAAWRKFH
jgi:hypothetical protein